MESYIYFFLFSRSKFLNNLFLFFCVFLGILVFNTQFACFAHTAHPFFSEPPFHQFKYEAYIWRQTVTSAQQIVTKIMNDSELPMPLRPPMTMAMCARKESVSEWAAHQINWGVYITVVLTVCMPQHTHFTCTPKIRPNSFLRMLLPYRHKTMRTEWIILWNTERAQSA